ncbi:helix-turn-helix domain-containing protein [Chitinophaga sp. SYP-B3965]|uniref:helix-turn-helix domain-containing protein n=1 Tax=Chitinophaga sp. SYP-B3965 TaxID=2663120 RepID=UPI00129991BF|nr:helix-turn-helix transcriptional regulator [Chitinophaga sp. SYP-B3965]MRG45480.1 helix-turn-helix domain-containing protein [Chitinophaga sp. SYP-B3965]
MSIGQQILFLLGALGAFNGIILSFYLFLNKKRRSWASFFLGLLVLVFSIRVAKSVFLYFNPSLARIYLQIGLSGCFLIGPSLYYYFRSVILKPARLPETWKWVWGIQIGILLVVGILVPYETYPATWGNVFVKIIYLQWFAYLIATGLLLRQVLKPFYIVLYVGNCIVFLAYVLAYFNIMQGIYISGPICFTLILFLTIFFSSSESTKPERKKIADADLWISKLEKVIGEKQLYKDPNLKLNDLAQHINISMHQLSQLLNDNLGKSFSTYINEYRIAEACKLITTNGHLTFEAIGYEVGYNSKSTFYTAFRKIKDTTPALYKESIDNQL